MNDIDLNPFFKQYEALLKLADSTFHRLCGEFPDFVKCRIGCADCCHALFDVPLIEALYLHCHFIETIDPSHRERLLAKANRVDRKIFKIKRNAYRSASDGMDEKDIFYALAKERVRCPLLNAQEKCDLYAYRPITCRLYGIPTAFNGIGHTCGRSGFKKGETYPTVYIDAFYRKLYSLSDDVVRSIRSTNVKMSEMLVPVSMALLSEYDASYLGVVDEKKSDVGKGG